VPLGLTSSWDFLGPGGWRRRRRSCPPAAPAAQRGRTTWTATSTGALLARRGNPNRQPNRRATPLQISHPFPTAAGSATLEGRRRAGSNAVCAMADPTGYAEPSLAPGPSPSQQPERRQMTHTHDEVAYISVGARPPDSTQHTTRSRFQRQLPTGDNAPRTPNDLTRTTAS
jgi:hypothetical protein